MFNHKLQTRQGFGDCVIYSLVNLNLGTYKLIQDEIRELKHELATRLFKISYKEYYVKHGFGTPEFFIPSYLHSRGISFEKVKNIDKNFHGLVLFLDPKKERHAAACRNNFILDSHHPKPIPIKKFSTETLGNYLIDSGFCRNKLEQVNTARKKILKDRLPKLKVT